MHYNTGLGISNALAVVACIVYATDLTTSAYMTHQFLTTERDPKADVLLSSE